MKNTETMSSKASQAVSAQLDERTQNVARLIAGRKPVARNINQEYDASVTFGQRAADAVARFGGSWTFIMLFAAVLVVWIGLNSVLLVAHGGKGFDPYPYILLNLFLSMLAAIQAPIMLMSQNRQAEKDRLDAEHDYEVNLKAELEIMLLHEKVDTLRERQWSELLAIQTRQMELLDKLIVQQGTAAA